MKAAFRSFEEPGLFRVAILLSMLGGSWLVTSGVISPPIWVITILT